VVFPRDKLDDVREKEQKDDESEDGLDGIRS